MQKLRNLLMGIMVLFCLVPNVKAADEAIERALLNMQNQVNSLEQEIAAYRGKIEVLEHEKDQLSLENRELKAKLQEQEHTLKKEEQALKSQQNALKIQTSSVNMHRDQGGGTATLTTKNTEDNHKRADFVKMDANHQDKKDSEVKLKASTAASKKAYDEAYALLEKNELDKALLAFSSFAAKYPDDVLTPNSYYWLGQVQYLKKNYDKARVSFLNTAKFKSSPKRADALFKLGQTSEALGDKDKAKRFYEVLIASYPNSPSAALGKKALEKLEAKGQ